jgi:hypothetical protein
VIFQTSHSNVLLVHHAADSFVQVETSHRLRKANGRLAGAAHMGAVFSSIYCRFMQNSLEFLGAQTRVPRTHIDSTIS